MDDIEQILRWIHHAEDEPSLQALLRDFRNRWLAQPSNVRERWLPRSVREDGQPLAACYFKPLPGRVATLGGMRAAAGWEDRVASLLGRLAANLQGHGIWQVQAVVAEHDTTTAQLIQRAGFSGLTHVQHQWLDLTGLGNFPDTTAVDAPRVSSLLWRPAGIFARVRLARVIESTFRETLDCPGLNGLRDRELVLDGFLDGRQLRFLDSQWEVLEFRGELAGCLLLQQHPQGMVELVYLGLLPEARGKRLGRQLVDRAISQARRLKAHNLVAAVDEKNWPALELYWQFGFQPQQRFEIFLYPRH